MVRTFLQVAAGAADIPVTRLLGQSPAGLSATGDSDTRNYYDMIAARQEVDLRPQLERLDRLLLRSAGVEPEAVSFTFRPLWQMDAKDKAAIAYQKAQSTQIYAGLNLWPAELMARLVQAQLVEEAAYPNAEAIFGDLGQIGRTTTEPISRLDGAGSRPLDDAAMTEDCAQEWAEALERCERLLAEPYPNRRMTGGHTNVRDCARGFVGARRGGNPV